MPAPTIDGQRLRLRPLEPNDIEARKALGIVPEIVRAFGGDTPPPGASLSDAVLHAWFERESAERYSWAIEFERRFIGTVRLHSLDEHDRRASMAIGILDAGLLGKGLGTDAIRLVMRFAFETLAVHRLSIRVLRSNARAIRAYEKCGFVAEGIEREAALVDGVRVDDLMLGLLRSEWLAANADAR